MAFEEMKHHLSELDKRVISYVDDSLEYIELRGFKISMVLVTSLVKFFIYGSIGLLFLLVMTTAAAIALSAVLGGYHWGFLAVAGLYLLLGMLVYVLRKNIDKVILRFFSEKFFDKS